MSEKLNKVSSRITQPRSQGAGTPAGVGLGRKPPTFLEDGDALRLGITGLGEQSYRVFADKDL